MAWDGCAASNRLLASTLPAVLKGSKVSVEEACNALTWIHLTLGLSLTVGLSSPVVSPIVKVTLEGLGRMLAKPITKNIQVAEEILEHLVEDAEQVAHYQIYTWLWHVFSPLQAF